MSYMVYTYANNTAIAAGENTCVHRMIIAFNKYIIRNYFDIGIPTLFISILCILATFIYTDFISYRIKISINKHNNI